MAIESANDAQLGGFIGDPSEAFTPPAAGSCCGSPAGRTNDAANGCCGTDTAVAAADCCGAAPVGVIEVEASTGGCCG